MSRICGLLSLLLGVGAQMFEIPAEMLQGMMGGMMGGQQRQEKPPLEWPKTENSEISQEFEWLVNTEWKGKTAKYLLLRDGIIESPLKECEQEGRCLWAANNHKVLVNTPTLKVIKFTIEGFEKADKKKLQDKDENELKKLKLVTEKPSKSGKKSELAFERLASADASETIIAKDLYAILDVSEKADASEVKSKYRRMSIQNHPDKGGDPKVFNEIREAYEILSDHDQRRYYDLGGIQLVKNIDTAYKEMEGQKAQLDSQLERVPKNHPQRRQFEQQIEQQKMQFTKSRVKVDIEKKLQSSDVEVMVPISARELYTGVSAKDFQFARLVICRGCREDPNAPQCKECGRCPPEKVQVPKYSMTPFGRQVTGMREKEQESRERCREVTVPITGLRVAKGAKEGSTLKYVNDIGHQTPGKLPGKVVFKVQRGSVNDTYTIAENDLHTVLHISLQDAVFGFDAKFAHLGEETVSIRRSKMTKPDDVVRLPNKGLMQGAGGRGDLFVRLHVDMPDGLEGQSLTLQAPEKDTVMLKPRLEREDPVDLRDGAVWRRWRQRENAKTYKPKSKGGTETKQSSKDEL